MKGGVLARRLLVSALTGYAVLLVLAAWRAEIRPAAFDRATAFARGTLGLAGIPPGVAVFSANTRGAPDAKIAAVCLEVRRVGDRPDASGGRSDRVYPPEGVECPATGPRLWVRGEEIFLQRAALMLRAHVAALRTGTVDHARTDFAELLARSIGAHFVARDAAARAAGRDDRSAEPGERQMLLWRETRVSYRTRGRTDRIVALMQWPNVPDPRVVVAWRPDERTLLERGWPGTGSGKP